MSASEDSGFHGQVAQLFERAIDLPVGERQDFLERTGCGEVVVARVRALLVEDEKGTKDYLLSPVTPVDAGRAQEIHRFPDETVEMPRRIGRYRILRVLGSGGMGRVYLAEQPEPVRVLVALKVVKQRLASASGKARFEKERDVLQLMQHGNVARILDGGTTESGLPYFVMEYVPGAASITSHAQGKGLSIAERLTLFLAVCEAVHHGHEQGILHRDLKPSNVLVGADGIPKLIDFGIARSLGADAARATQMTEVGQILGTLQYMSPEQVESGGRDLDARSDVYSLGVILYELLTDSLPYDVSGLSLVQAAQRIGTTKPPRASLLQRALRGDLDTILSKALEKEPERRYASVRALAEDIARASRSEPIQARPATVGYQLTLFARRHRGLTIGLGATLVALAMGSLTSFWWGLRAVQAREDALAMTRFVTASLESSDPTKYGEPATIAGLLGRMASGLESHFGSRPEMLAPMQATIGRTYAAIGDYGRATGPLEQASRLLEESHGLAHPAALHARVALGAVYMEQGRMDEAQALIEDCLVLLGAGPGDLLATKAEALFTLGVLLDQQGRVSAALAALEGAAEILGRLRGEEDLDTLEVQSLLGTVLFDVGETARAESLLTHVVEVERRRLGRARSDSLGNLGYLYAGLGRLDEAQALLRAAHEQNLAVLGPEHPWTLGSAVDLAGIYLERSELQPAEALLTDNLERARRIHRPDHPTTLSLCEMLAQVHVENDCSAQAMALLDEAIRGCRHVPRRELDLARVLLLRGSYDEDPDGAEVDLLEAYQLRVELLGEGSAPAQEVAQELAFLYRDLGQDESAAHWRARLSQPHSGE